HKTQVNVWATTRRQTVAGQIASALMLLLWFGLLATAASPSLHRVLHKDAQNPTHNCVVTQVQQQLLLSGFQHLAAAPPSLPDIATAPLLHLEFPQSTDLRLSPS